MNFHLAETLNDTINNFVLCSAYDKIPKRVRNVIKSSKQDMMEMLRGKQVTIMCLKYHNRK
jgi:hypothetical protein